MYLTHPLMVIDPCAKYGMPMSNLTEVTGRTWKHDKSQEMWPKVEGQHQFGNVLVIYSQGDSPMCQICLANVKPKKGTGRTWKHGKNPYKFDPEVKVLGPIWIMNVRDSSSFMAIHPCAKYGKSMSNQKKNIGGTRIYTQTDRRTDRQSDSYIFTGGIMRCISNDVDIIGKMR